MSLSQADRIFEVTSPLGGDTLLFRSIQAREHLSRPFEFELELLSEDYYIKHEDVLGQPLTVRYDLPNEGPVRYFNGNVSQFSFEGSSGRFAVYRAHLRPWLWLLTRTADCRIFQEMTVPDIIKKVFRDLGFTDLEDKLTGSYRTWEYCVQYRETDFNFVSRLMEQEGIYYYFLHEDGKHTLILSDSVSAHSPIPNYENVPYFPPEDGAHRERDHLWHWSVSQQVQPGKYELTDFDFEKPHANLDTRISKPRAHSHGEYEIYDYPGEYVETGDGDRYVGIRLEELQSQNEWVLGNGDAGGLYTGGLFQLSGYPRDDQNREYMIVSCILDLRSDDYESGSTAAGETTCQVAITAIDSKTPYRAPRVTPKPVVQGPQTAMVVGKDGEEIWTDRYGRVKVQFHWDREGKNDENSSCWIRVAQLWAGKSWGGIHIPRIGQEVIVDFLEGDPDRPIVTGRVYNADTTVPYALPDKMTQSGIKSRSTKDGTDENFNEVRFDDEKGEEEFYVHAEKDYNRVVENNDTLKVGFDKKEDGNQEIEIHNNQTLKIGNGDAADGSQTVEIWKDRTVSLKTGDDSLTIAQGLRVVEAMQSIELKVGASSIKIDQQGVEIKGMMIKVDGTAMTEVNGLTTNVNGTGILTLKGGLTKIN